MSAKVFVVTGANKGIGYGIVRGLARQQKGAIIYLTARNSSLGSDAVQELMSRERFAGEVRFHQLDITDAASCAALADHLSREHGGLDVLVNNAGMAYKMKAPEPPGEQAEGTMRVNYYGTKLVSRKLEPLIRAGGRIVNICSQCGMMNGRYKYKQELIDRFRRPDFTETDIDTFVEEYKKLAQADKRKEGGYPETAYGVSKAAEIAFSMLLARELSERNIWVNACCPGYVDTDMTSHKGPLTLEKGAETPIFLATDSSVNTGGKFYYLKKVKEWL